MYIQKIGHNFILMFDKGLPFICSNVFFQLSSIQILNRKHDLQNIFLPIKGKNSFYIHLVYDNA